MKRDGNALPSLSLSRRKFAIGMLFCSAAAIAAWRQPRQHLNYLGDKKLESIVPNTIGSWTYLTSSGLVVPPSDQLLDDLYSQVLTRVYVDGSNPPVMLLMAQSAGQTGVLQVHRPEVCYPAGGYELSPTVQHEVRLGSGSLKANKLVASVEAMSEQILYWIRVGNRMPMSWRDQRIAVAEQNLRGIVPDAILIRVSTRSHNQSAAFDTLAAFVQALIRSIPPSSRRVLIG